MKQSDLEQVAKAVGWHPTIAHPSINSLLQDDGAAKWILPWLRREYAGFPGFSVGFDDAIRGYGYWHSKDDADPCGYEARFHISASTFALALIGLCVARLTGKVPDLE